MSIKLCIVDSYTAYKGECSGDRPDSALFWLNFTPDSCIGRFWFGRGRKVTERGGPDAHAPPFYICRLLWLRCDRVTVQCSATCTNETTRSWGRPDDISLRDRSPTLHSAGLSLVQFRGCADRFYRSLTVPSGRTLFWIVSFQPFQTKLT